MIFLFGLFDLFTVKVEQCLACSREGSGVIEDDPTTTIGKQIAHSILVGCIVVTNDLVDVLFMPLYFWWLDIFFQVVSHLGVENDSFIVLASATTGIYGC